MLQSSIPTSMKVILEFDWLTTKNEQFSVYVNENKFLENQVLHVELKQLLELSQQGLKMYITNQFRLWKRQYIW
jgi:hypothetical protein